MFKRCPYQYYLRYVKDMKIPPKSSIILGSAIHETMAWGFQEKKDSGVHPKTDLWEQKYVERLEKQFEIVPPSEIDWGEGDNKYKIKDDGVKLVKKYDTEVGVNVIPSEVEKEFEIMFENTNYSLKGKIDLLKSESIVDFKTGNKKYNEEQIIYDDQLTIYQIASPKSFLEIHGLIRKQNAEIQIIKIKKRTKKEIEKTLADLAYIVKAIDTGLFYKINDPLKCSWCGFQEVCRKK